MTKDRINGLWRPFLFEENEVPTAERLTWRAIVNVSEINFVSQTAMLKYNPIESLSNHRFDVILKNI